MKLAPVLALAAILGAFMTLDKLTLHWYAPETGTSSITERGVERIGAGLPSPTPGPPTPVAGQSPVLVTAPEIRGAFEALWVAGQRAVYRIRYDTRSDANVAGDSYIVFNRPPDARVDTVASGEHDPSLQVVVDSTGKTIACSPGSSGRQCAPIQGFASPLPLTAGPIVFPAPDTFSSFMVIEVFPRAIAGAAARCFQLQSNASDATTAEFCFTIDGVPVYASGPFGVVEASELSSDVSNADFDLTTP